MIGPALGILAAALVAGALLLWFRWIREVSLEGRRRFAYAMIAAAIVLAIGSFASGPGLLGGVLAGAALLVGAVWIALGLLARQSRQAPAIEIGAPAPDFTLPDHEGAPFRLSSLRGRPVLMKLFRGHW
jgi:hypothetical protein